MDRRLRDIRFLWAQGADKLELGGEIVRRQRGSLYSRPVAPDDELTTTEAAAAAGVSRMTIHRWILNSELKASVRHGERRVKVGDIRLAALAHGGLPKTPVPSTDTADLIRRELAAIKGRVPAKLAFRHVELEIFGDSTGETNSLG